MNPPPFVLEIQQLYLQHVARLCALDRDRSGQRVDRVEAHVHHVRGGRLHVDLAVDGGPTLEPDLREPY